jgi:drug/metabolite transporter (DMT)-like permease
MLRGGIIVIIAIVSVLFLGRKLYRHHYLGLFMVIMGITLVGASAVLFPDDKKDPTPDPSPNPDPTPQYENVSLGIIIMLISLLLQAGIFISEEVIMKKYYF